MYRPPSCSHHSAFDHGLLIRVSAPRFLSPVTRLRANLADFQGGGGASSGTLDGGAPLTTTDSVVVSVLPGRVDPRMTSISGKGFDKCTAATQVGKATVRAFSPIYHYYCRHGWYAVETPSFALV